MIRFAKRFSYILTLILALILILSALPFSAYADEYVKDESAASLGRINLDVNGYMVVKQVNLLSDQTGNTVTFTVSVTNSGTNSFSFADYWIRLQGEIGNSFVAKMMPQDKAKSRIAAHSTQEFSYYASINEAASLDDLKFSLMKWDFTQESFEHKLGDVQVPSDYSNVTPAGRSLTVKLSGTTTKLAVSMDSISENGKYRLPRVKLSLENVDAHSLTLPDYQFAIRTSEGYSYPLTSKDVTELVINPQEVKEATFTGSIPVQLSAEDWQFVITQYVSDLKINVPIASMALPPARNQDITDANKEAAFSDENGVYTARLNGMYRLPWEDQDILTADLSLTNQDVDSLPVPDMTGYYLLDETVKADAKIVIPAKVMGIAKGSTVSLQMAAKIPYTYEFSRVKLVLQNHTSDQKTVDVLQFETSAEMLNVPVEDASASFMLTDSGYKSQYSIHSVKTYEGQSSNLFTAQVSFENEEKRFTHAAKLAASFRAADGTVYPAEVLDVKGKVGPGGRPTSLSLASCRKM
ncbi:hypothetical protein [Paenibacillus hexagrammi]|uniref:Uncharacterized protein n=1 Tax=Paenibacillus hexagrammi TaxID=2908839 RepID=A0ABY3SNQ4_9BACL|nr:hypothetical protein [Paenibacillus sp. YPD9-1]UJF35576.1 hypothetical protein L0M14_11025 [Paenibacillus sp. YPD9-1]